MAPRYSVTRKIDAPAGRVWDVLTDAGTFADWNDSIISFEGPIEQGKKVKLVSVVNPKRSFSLLVSTLQPPTTMVWEDGMPLGSGPLAGLITRMIPDLTESFDLFADSLKRTAEAG